MLQNILTQKEDSIENRQSGMEGLAVAIIEMAIKDLESNNSHTNSAVYFFKNRPELVKFWLSAATHDGKQNLDINLAKKILYSKAVEVEKRLSQKKEAIARQKELLKKMKKMGLKKTKPNELSSEEEKKLESVKAWANAQIQENQRLEEVSKIATYSSENPVLYALNNQHMR